MQMEHAEYLKLQNQLQDHFDGRYRKIEDCDDIVTTEEDKIDKLKESISELKLEQAKTNTRLAILIGILSAIGIPVLSVCVKLLFGG
jgi:capsular polysaccharide biosynthesis protein